ncbi:hypothetical protein [Streptomyces sp. G45]|uniref:hypothetical protein n=1 Tax=Streptomyces sp. G45 TaxID=3406627 RepID=UPI003C284577
MGNALDGGPERGSWPSILKPASVPCASAPWDDVVAGAGMGVEARGERVAVACGLDGDRLHAWSRVSAPFTASAHLGGGGEGPVTDEPLALAR